MPEARVVCTLEIETDGKSRTLTLDDKIVSFGRSRKNTVPLRDDAKVSAEHCQIVRQKDAWTLIDCGSKNKTFLNGTPVSVAALRNGDKIRVGNTNVTFRQGEPAPLNPRDAERLMDGKPTVNEAAAKAIAAALTPPKSDERAEQRAPSRAAKKSSGLREAVRVERGAGRSVSAFAMACFFVAGTLSGLTALFVFDGGRKAEKAPVAAKTESVKLAAGDVLAQPAADAGTPVADPPKEEPVAVKDPVVPEPPKEEPVKPEPPKEEPADVAVKNPVTPEPPKEEPVKPEPPKESPVASDPPPAASDEPPTGEPEDVAAKTPPKEDKPEVPGGGTAPEDPDEDKRPPTQFMGLRTKLRNVVFVMDVTGSMEDPASVTPTEYSGPPEIKLSAEIKRQLEKFDRKDVKTKLDAAKYELANAIAWLHPDVNFTVIFYSFSPTPWQNKFMPAADKNKIDAIKRIKTQAAWGGTNIFDALEKAFGIIDDHKKTQKKPAAPPPGGGTEAKKAAYSIFLVTDGKHNTGRFPDPEEFLREIKKLNSDGRAIINTIGVGQPGVGVDPPDPAFLGRLAEENGGECKMVK
ncbi:MAG: FHA domain-containing protein [Planctomycetes bacterium]|nr:FHA domain-containing protein [Planctomycetota bacterium]